MENINGYFECEIENLQYTTIERKISQHFNMGYPDNSNIPPRIMENSSDDFVLVCTRKSGEFNITNYKLDNGKYMLSVSLIGKLQRS